MTPHLNSTTNRFIGCCGWPEGKAKYFAHSPVVELQCTFYDLPSVQLAQKWRALAPPYFQFFMKAWQLITHNASSPTYRKLKGQINASELEEFGLFRPTEQVVLAWERTTAIAHALEATVVLFQCPKSFLPSSENVRNLNEFFTRIGPQQFTMAWEPRGDWSCELVREICTAHTLVHCVDPFHSRSVTGGMAYWRLHGMGGYRHRYSADELEHLRFLLIESERQGRTPSYILFNNVWMKDDSRRFAELLAHPQHQ